MSDPQEPEPCEVTWETADDKGRTITHHCFHGNKSHPGKHECDTCNATR